MQSKYRFPVYIVVFLHVLMSGLIMASEFDMPPLLHYYLTYLPIATAFVGAVDSVIGLRKSNWGCRIFSVISGVLSILIMLLSIMLFCFNDDLILNHFRHFGTNSFIKLLAGAVWLCWILRGRLLPQSGEDDDGAMPVEDAF